MIRKESLQALECYAGSGQRGRGQNKSTVSSRQGVRIIALVGQSLTAT